MRYSSREIIVFEQIANFPGRLVEGGVIERAERHPGHGRIGQAFSRACIKRIVMFAHQRFGKSRIVAPFRKADPFFDHFFLVKRFQFSDRRKNLFFVFDDRRISLQEIARALFYRRFQDDAGGGEHLAPDPFGYFAAADSI